LLKNNNSAIFTVWQPITIWVNERLPHALLHLTRHEFDERFFVGVGCARPNEKRDNLSDEPGKVFPGDLEKRI
jgi:hypothetical protein